MVLLAGMEHDLRHENAERALRFARELERLCTEPVAPEVLRALRHHSPSAVLLGKGLTPLGVAHRYVALCRKRAEAQ